MHKLDAPGSKWFEVGERVRLKMPQMTRVRGRKLVKTGVIVRIDGAYIAVRPSGWPKRAFIEFYPNELERFKCNVR